MYYKHKFFLFYIENRKNFYVTWEKFVFMVILPDNIGIFHIFFSVSEQ